MNLICAFFEWSIERLKNPWVIAGLVILLLGVLLLVFSNKIAYEITLRLKNSDDKKLANVGLAVKFTALVVVVIGALLAVLFI